MLKVAVICVLLTTDRPLYDTPEPEMLRVAPEMKFVPVSVTGTLAPGAPEEGLIDVRVGVRFRTVKVTEPLFPLVVVTLTV